MLVFSVVFGVLVGSWYHIRPQSVPSSWNRLPVALTARADRPARLDARQKVSRCRVHDGLPDHACTPGSVFPNATLEEICVSGYTQRVRKVSAATKRRVYQAYGFTYPQPRGAFEVDHLIPLAIGGNNEISNLFLEAAEPRPGYHEKDLVEIYLRQQVCARKMDLGPAQEQVATDWVAIYRAFSPGELKELLQESRTSWEE